MKLAKHDLGGKLNDGENDGGKNKRRGISEKELEEYTESLESTVALLGFVRQIRGPNVSQLRSIHSCQIR